MGSTRKCQECLGQTGSNSPVYHNHASLVNSSPRQTFYTLSHVTAQRRSQVLQHGEYCATTYVNQVTVPVKTLKDREQ